MKRWSEMEFVVDDDALDLIEIGEIDPKDAPGQYRAVVWENVSEGDRTFPQIIDLATCQTEGPLRRRLKRLGFPKAGPTVRR